MSTEGRCRSRSRYGNCGLHTQHDGEHAVYVGDDVWFFYPRRTVGSLGYGRFCGDTRHVFPDNCDCRQQVAL